MANKTVIKILVENGLKVTPQRIAILEVILILKNHPTAEKVIEYIRISHPNIAIGTVYKNLETFVEKGIINKIRTDKESMKYDTVLVKHHHLSCYESDRMEDFIDDNLYNLIDDYLKKNKIPDFKIEDIKLNLVGKFTDNPKDKRQK